MSSQLKIAILLMIFFSSCQSSQRNSGGFESEDLIGSWSNISMTITYLDRDSVFSIPAGKWEEILQIKPIVTTYKGDSSYESKYYGLSDSLLFTTTGKWYFKNDSLYLTNQESTTIFHFSRKGSVGRFTGVMDWNQDGIAKELYDGLQEKIP